jgi:pimeloyl-ACP methyl ester carboxylesterase
MPTITTDDSVKLAYTEAGSGTPMVFVHEFAGDMRSWEPQLRFFARRARCVAFNARGYPPSDVPQDGAMYHQNRAADDIAAVLRGLDIARAHIVGLSMGAFATLHFGLRHPDLALSLTAAGVGYGAEPGARERFRTEAAATAARFQAEGMEAVAASYSRGPTRIRFASKDPRGFAEFQRQLAEHSATGSALTMLGVQRERPSLYDLEDRLRALALPTLIIAGDEDDPSLQPSLFLKRVIPASGLLMLPRTGHTMNLEEPDAFNRAVLDFVSAVEANAWGARDAASLGEGILVTRD